jgi:hypothetical protein
MAPGEVAMMLGRISIIRKAGCSFWCAGRGAFFSLFSEGFAATLVQCNRIVQVKSRC